MEHDQSTPEVLSDELHFRLIDGVANIEGKLLTTALITANPDRYFTRAILNRELVDRQGTGIGWKPSDRMGERYCTDSIEPIGAAVRGIADGLKGPISTYTATEFGVEHALPFTGVLLDWSLRHPEISVQKIFGATPTTGEVRSPSSRYLIYQAILTGGTEGSSYQDVINSLNGYGLTPKVVEGQLRALDHLGIVNVNSKNKYYNPRIQILSPDYFHTAIAFEDLQPETKIFYKTAKELFNSGKHEINMNSFLEASLTIDPKVDLAKIRKVFLMGIQDTNSPNIALIDKGSLGENRTYVTFGEGYREPIEELCEAIEAVKAGQDLDNLRVRAKQIINNPADFSALMAKSKLFSSAVRGKTQDLKLKDKIADLILTEPGLSAKQISERLSEDGDTYAIKTVRVALNGLVIASQATKSKVVEDPSKKTSVDIFSPL